MVMFMPRTSVSKLLEQAYAESVITCPKCGKRIEPDAEKCQCGWTNVLVKGCWI